MTVSLDMLPSVEELLAEKSRRRLADFTRHAWHVVDPAEYIHNWHIDAIAEHLEAVTAGQIRNLVINVPPGHMKSLEVCVFWPAWEWIERGHRQFLFSSYASDLVERDSVKCRSLLTSPWYQSWFTPDWRLIEDTNRRDYFQNSMHGVRACLSVGGKTTGYRGDVIVVDDPLNAKDAHSEAARRNVLNWWDQGMINRLNDMQVGARVIIMQRLHEEDLTGHVLSQTAYRWEHLCLPSEFEPHRRSVTSIGWCDPRKTEGELLFPARFPAAEITKEKQSKGAAGYAGQHQQRPAPAEGNLFKKAWFRYYHPTPDGAGYILHDPVRGNRLVLKVKCRKRFATADTAPTAKEKSDFTCVGIWDETPEGDLLLVDAVHERLEDPDTERRLVQIEQSHRPLFIGIENKQNGTTLIQRLLRQGVRVRSLEADRDKVSRSSGAQIDCENGKVYFNADAAYLAELEAELQTFPNGAHDDWVDMLSYASILKGQSSPPVSDFGSVSALTPAVR